MKMLSYFAKAKPIFSVNECERVRERVRGKEKVMRMKIENERKTLCFEKND